MATIEPMVGWHATADDYAHLVESLARFAEYDLEQGSEDVSPCMALLTREEPWDGQQPLGVEIVSFLGIDWNDRAQRYAAIRHVGYETGVRRVMVAAVAILSSAWVSRFPADQVPANRPAPEDDPDHVERAVVFGLRLAAPEEGVRNSVADLDRSGAAPRLSGWQSTLGRIQSRLLQTFLEGLALGGQEANWCR